VNLIDNFYKKLMIR